MACSGKFAGNIRDWGDPTLENPGPLEEDSLERGGGGKRGFGHSLRKDSPICGGGTQLQTEQKRESGGTLSVYKVGSHNVTNNSVKKEDKSTGVNLIVKQQLYVIDKRKNRMKGSAGSGRKKTAKGPG